MTKPGLLLPKPVSGEILTAEDKAIIEKEGRQITPNERADLITYARSLGLSERAVVVRSFASQDWIKYQALNWGFVTGYSYTTNDKIIEVSWVANGMKSTYTVDELDVIHKGMEYLDCKDIITKYKETKKNAAAPPVVPAQAAGYDLYGGHWE